MPSLTRRAFLANAAASVAASRLHAQTSSAAQVTLALPAQAAGPQMPAGFVGLSYEIQQLKDPAFFSASNSGLIRQFRALSRQGVLRMGGNTSEFGWWKPSPDSPEPTHPQTRVVAGEPQPQYYPVSAEAVNNLDAFLRATDWTCIYGLNLGTGTPERAAQEATYVAKTLGSRLEYFQVGNEVDLFTSHLRDPKTWTPQAYLKQWLMFARAVSAAVPGAKFGMPDIASHMDWLTEIAAVWPTIQNPPKIVCLSHHYYFGGPATNPKVNIPNLLSWESVATVQHMADVAKAAADKIGVPLRMTEGNTCYRGGKPGVSDVFAAAMWAADYALHLAVNGYTGVNLHGGSGPSVANSVGGSLPGDQILRQQGETPEQIDKHPHPFYTPVASFGAKYELEPVAYGLKFAAQMIGGTFFKGDLSSRLQAAGVDATAYAASFRGGELRVVILNKDAQRDLNLELDCGSHRSGTVEKTTLRAPALDSRQAEISPATSSGHINRGRCTVTVPRATGICLSLRA